MLLGKRLKELRLEKKLSQSELGDLVNVTKVSICCYENGTRVPTLDTLTKLGEVLGVDVNSLLGYDTKTKTTKRSRKTVIMSKEEIEFIEELRKNESIHEQILANPKVAVQMISKSFE